MTCKLIYILKFISRLIQNLSKDTHDLYIFTHSGNRIKGCKKIN